MHTYLRYLDILRLRPCADDSGGWGLLAAVAVYLAPTKLTRREAVALVTLHNSPDPWTAFKGLVVFAYESFPLRKKNSTWPEFIIGLSFGLIALGVFVTSIVMGIVGPPLLQIGNVAPVRPSSPYYPELPANPLAVDLNNGYRSLAVLRALSSVEIARTVSRSQVSITHNTSFSPNTANSDLAVTMGYSYALTGPDFGLVHASDLKLQVEGACRTEYSWLNTTHPNQTTIDLYNLWNIRSVQSQIQVQLNATSINTLPRASFSLHPGANSQLRQDGNVSYSVLVGSAHRPSISAGSDPWYATEPRNRSFISSSTEQALWVKSGRPPLSCWQKDSWSYGETQVRNVYHLRNTTGIPIPSVLLEVLEMALSLPLVVVIGTIAGPSALESMVTSPGGANSNGLIDANAANIRRDMERLIVAGFVFSQNVFVDSTAFPSSQRPSLGNIFDGADGRPRDGAGQFVVATPDVQTFTLTGLIILAVVIATLILLKTLLLFKLILHADAHPDPSSDSEIPHDQQSEPTSSLSAPHEPGQGLGQRATTTTLSLSEREAPSRANTHVGPPGYNTDRWMRFKVFSASNILRNVYEGGIGHPQLDWDCCEEFPHDKPGDDRFHLARCKDGKCACGGHIVGWKEGETEKVGRKSRPGSLVSGRTTSGMGERNIGGVLDEGGGSGEVRPGMSWRGFSSGGLGKEQ